jgi:hypothetical protein
MADGASRKVLGRVTRGVPVAQVLTLAQVAMLARQHWRKLEPAERRRLMALIRRAGARRGHLSAGDRAELNRLVAKADPRMFAGLVAQRFSPVPLPRRFVRGKR